MTRARILADYVAGGTTAAEFDYLDGLTSTAVGINDTQTLANKTLASTTTFPAGHIIKSELIPKSDGVSSSTSHGYIWSTDTNKYKSTGSIPATVPTGSTSCYLTFNYWMRAYQNSDTSIQRSCNYHFYQHTSSVAYDLSSSTGFTDTAYGTDLYSTDSFDYWAFGSRSTTGSNDAWHMSNASSITYHLTGLTAGNTYHYHLVSHNNTPCALVQSGLGNLVIHWIKA